MDDHRHEVLSRQRFEFGANWKKFLHVLDDERIEMAELSLRSMFGNVSFQDKTFLDIGSGSGLFSLAARRLGAKVTSFDYDPHSVACTKVLRDIYFPDDSNWKVIQGSVLDQSFIKTLGQFQFVYSWGVLHHTGAMWDAIRNSLPLVAKNGKFFIAIYNDQGSTSKQWWYVKRAYNAVPAFMRWVVLYPSLIRLWAPTFIRDLLRGKPLHTWRHYAEQNLRGMTAWRDVVDWVGGFPFEVAKPEDIFDLFIAEGFSLEKMRTCGGGFGCNEFIFINTKIAKESSLDKLVEIANANI